MKKFNAKRMLPLVASLVLGVGLSTQASALEQDKDFTITPDAYPTTADCYVHTPKGCPNHVGYDAQGWYPDVHGRHTNAQNDVNACFARAADYNDWCGGDETTQALFVSNTGEVTLDSAVDAESFSGGQTVYLKSHHGTYFYMADGDFKVGTKRPSSKMELVRVGGSGPIKFGDKIALKSVDGSGVYVTAMHAGEQHNAVARATKLDGWETFTIVDRNGNTPNLVVTAETAFALKGAHNLHMVATPDGQAKASVPQIDDWEMVRLEAISSSGVGGITCGTGTTLDSAKKQCVATSPSTLALQVSQLTQRNVALTQDNANLQSTVNRQKEQLYRAEQDKYTYAAQFKITRLCGRVKLANGEVRGSNGTHTCLRW